MKNRFIVVRKLVAILLLGTMIVGCSYTRYGVEISNVPNIKEIYIRNAGTTNWGTDIARNIQDIDKSRFSEEVDIRVLDTNGVVYSRYNVPFNDAAFIETAKTSHLNKYSLLGVLVVGLGAYYLITRSGGEDE